MPKRFIQRITPDHEVIRSHKHLQIFGTLLHDPNLWHLNRRSASGAFAVGLFMAFMPVPFQMLLAASAAIFFRVNLPLSVALVWITNPITIPPMFYFAYLIGTWVLGAPPAEGSAPEQVALLSTGPTVWDNLGVIWQPLLLGSFICATVSAVVGYLAIRGLWRLRVVNHLKQRKGRVANRHRADPSEITEEVRHP